MGITQNINHFFLSFTAFFIVVWGRVTFLLPSQSSNTPPSSPALDIESQSPETESYSPSPVTIRQISQNPETQPLHSDTIAPEMLQPPLQPLNPSHTPTSSPAIDLETQAQPSLTLNQGILLQAAQTPPQPMEIELQLVPPMQQTPSPAINTQQINMIIVKQITLEWPNIIMAFCFEAAIQIALQYETTQHSKLSIPFYLRSFSILLTFFYLCVSQLMSKKFPDTSKVLEKVAIFLTAIVFFTTIATPLVPSP